jgi:hypothetical protein
MLTCVVRAHVKETNIKKKNLGKKYIIEINQN